jgi:hypothetical protein
MENKIDQFFKDKMEGHTLPPSEDAWAKVETNLSKKNNFAVWRIAAAILITGALISVIIWSQCDEKNNEQILAAKKSLKDSSTKEKPAPQISPVQNKKEEKSANKKPSNALPRFVSPQTKSKTDKNESNESKTQSTQTQPSIELAAKEIIEKNNSSFATAFVETSAVKKALEDKEKLNTKATTPTTIASTKQKPIKLEFTLDDFSSEQPVATASEEKSSGLKKVWDLAREVKNGDGPVHEIKNELFALSFKKNKNQ